jgi:hypothetical protein
VQKEGNRSQPYDEDVVEGTRQSESRVEGVPAAMQLDEDVQKTTGEAPESGNDVQEGN